MLKKKKEYAYISIFPEMKNLKKGYLTDEEIDFFGEYLDYSKLSKDEQVMEYWQSLLDEEEMEWIYIKICDWNINYGENVKFKG